ncbi:MAG TPA: glycosyltransferase family 4 protein [Solirubrobacteraceae bacterium]|nr:glycosyltransferase family 4 protein [Solirubrobacteraceae bacterium]
MRVRVHVVDPPAYTPPYDHALCAALAAAGAEVELHTSRFAYAPVPPARGYRRREDFYRVAARVRKPRMRRAVRLAEHVPDMLRYRRTARAADVVHFQWLAVQQLDRRLLPSRRSPAGARRPLVLTAHDVLPREPRPGQLAAQRRLYDGFDAIVVHSEHGSRRLTEELGVDPSRVHVIPHGVLTHLAQPRADELPLPFSTDRPVVLCFGLMRPYKGIDLLLEAWRGIEDAELWIAGMPRMDITPLVASAPPGVRFVPRFIPDIELPAYFRRADLVVLPYREIEQSGVLFTALAFARPLLLSDVGGFPEIAATGAARTFPAGDSRALGEALVELLADSKERSRMQDAARSAAATRYSWEAVARSTLELYEGLLREDPAR